MNDINPRAHQHADIRQGVRDACRAFDSSYWQQVEEESSYPEVFVQALTEAGWLAALIPEEFGGSGASLTEASVILEEINRSGANSGACHAQMYTMGTLLRHGSLEQIASSELHRGILLFERSGCRGSPEGAGARARTGSRWRPL